MPTDSRYFVWSPRGEVYHDANGLRCVSWPECFMPMWGSGLCHAWIKRTRPPRGRRLCQRCEKLRKGAKG